VSGPRKGVGGGRGKKKIKGNQNLFKKGNQKGLTRKKRGWVGKKKKKKAKNARTVLLVLKPFNKFKVKRSKDTGRKKGNENTKPRGERETKKPYQNKNTQRDSKKKEEAFGGGKG